MEKTGQAGAHAARGWQRLGPWLILLLLQALVAFLVLRPFLEGRSYFAYLDIAQDTYSQFTAFPMLLARLFAREGWSGWSFDIGLGAPVAFMVNDTFRLLTLVGGPEHVLQLRIWVYLLQLALGGMFFLLLVREFVARKEAAVLAALLYSFSGYMVINGVWDSERAPFVFFPLILWAMLRHLRRGDLLAFPLAVGAALLAGMFFVTLAVSLAVAAAACIAMSDTPRATAGVILRRLVPLAAVGFLIGSPVALPSALQLLDSPRVSGPDSLISKVTSQALRVSDLRMVLFELSGFFHKDLLGSGNFHLGYMNYLEGPGFWVGMLPLVLLPQLWRGTRQERRALLVGVAGIALYVLVPLFRLAAFGFATDYFRATTLWPTIALLLLGAVGLDRVFREGADRLLVVVGAFAVSACLLAVWLPQQDRVSVVHAIKVLVFVGGWALLLLATSLRRGGRERLPVLAAMLATIEVVVFVWPSFLASRATVDPGGEPLQDVTIPAVAAIRRLDPGVYRIEKTFETLSQSDAAGQDYMGVKSYYYHGGAVVDFHRNMDMMRPFGRFKPVNFTNWLETPGDRYPVYSALGVKYIISKEPLTWPAFEQVAAGEGWFVYRNKLALPFGVVHTRQVTRADMDALVKLAPDRQRWFRDFTLLNAVVLDQPLPQWGSRWDLAGEAGRGIIDLPHLYGDPAEALQRTGLQITQFENDHIVGRIQPAERGILVFSIPDYRGWSISIDGQPAPLMRANFGMIATPVTAGPHTVELRYTLPGLAAGAGLGAVGLLVLVFVAMRRRAPREASMGAPALNAG